MQAWEAYRNAWRSDTVLAEVRRAVANPSRHVRANSWQLLSVTPV